MKKSTLLSLDAFARPEEDVRVRTRTGGLITVSCFLVLMVLLAGEWSDFKQVVSRPQLVVDRDRHLKFDLNVDITFPSVPCDLLSLDIMDDSGEVQLDLLSSGFTKTRVDSEGKSISTENLDVGQTEDGNAPEADENYCGPCYGARDQSQNENLEPKDRVCCQTCSDVRDAYAAVGWAFFDGKNIQQCEKEGYVTRINERINEGCRVKGNAQLNRIQGNIHFAPGRSIRNKRGHFHDTSLYDKTPQLNFNHIINHLSFGKDVADGGVGSVSIPADAATTVASCSPLDGRQEFPPRDTHFHQFSYFAKIVPTRYEYLDGRIVETTQFSATYHSRPLKGGRDEDHPSIMHAATGIPGLFINFEMSALKVINREQHKLTWSGFLLNCITSIGGVLAVGTVMDRIVYKAQRSIWSKKGQ